MRRFTRAAACLVLATLALAADYSGVAADDYPARPVRVIVGFGPGSTADYSARTVAQKLSLKYGQQFVVESRAGAGSNLAAEFVARAPKDGYTLLMGTVANTINATISKLNFDFARDFAPIALVSTVPNILVAHPATGFRTVADVVAAAKREQMMYGSSGVGSALHVYGELLNITAGIKMTHVPYPGSAQSLTDLLAGRISVMFSPAPTVLPHIQAGALTAIAATSPRVLPDLPTMADAGYKGFDAGLWFGMLAPAGTPREIVDKVSAGINEALKMDDVVQALRKQGFEPLGGTPDDFAGYIKSEIAQWGRVAEAAGLKK
ncbi:MAG: tripartite tricarboxylate transporter substrate binding protein [Xanthobacteraceae bacterium]|nr:tripartite tricarboxylate transporter substrate binding protein [Xanthobacteraceae bacterium]